MICLKYLLLKISSMTNKTYFSDKTLPHPKKVGKRRGGKEKWEWWSSSYRMKRRMHCVALFICQELTGQALCHNFANTIWYPQEPYKVGCNHYFNIGKNTFDIGFLHKQTLGKGYECKQSVWEAIPGNKVRERANGPGKGGKPIVDKLLRGNWHRSSGDPIRYCGDHTSQLSQREAGKIM